MTNWEFLKATIDGEIDDGHASSDVEIYYHIDCPYYPTDKRCECRDVIDTPDEITREMCVRCKKKWLEAEKDG